LTVSAQGSTIRAWSPVATTDDAFPGSNVFQLGRGDGLPGCRAGRGCPGRRRGTRRPGGSQLLGAEVPRGRILHLTERQGRRLHARKEAGARVLPLPHAVWARRPLPPQQSTRLQVQREAGQDSNRDRCAGSLQAGQRDGRPHVPAGHLTGKEVAGERAAAYPEDPISLLSWRSTNGPSVLPKTVVRWWLSL
jgi:hypothetical protein